MFAVSLFLLPIHAKVQGVSKVSETNNNYWKKPLNKFHCEI